MAVAGPWSSHPVLNLASSNSTGLSNASLSQSTDDSTLDNFTFTSPIIYPIAGTHLTLVINRSNPAIPPTDTLMLFITTMYTVSTAMYPRGDVPFQRSESVNFSYRSLGLVIKDISQAEQRLTYFAVGAVAMGLSLFVQQFGYFYMEFEIHKDGVGTIGFGRMYKWLILQSPQNVSLAPS